MKLRFEAKIGFFSQRQLHNAAAETLVSAGGKYLSASPLSNQQSASSPLPVEPLKRILKEIKKRGFCHGQCLALLPILKREPTISARELRVELGSQLPHCIALQAVEVVRAKNLLPISDEAFYPSPLDLQPCDLIVYPNPELAWERGQELAARPEGLYIVRMMNPKKKRAHSLLLHFSEPDRCFFFDSANERRFHCFPSKAELLAGLKNHLAARYSYLFQEEGQLVLEKHA